MNSVSPLDLLWTSRNRCIASALLHFSNVRILIDPGPASTLPALRAALASRLLSVHDIEAVLLTHIHLDHAGAAGSLVRENPNLRVFVHSRGAPHLRDPSKLLASALRLYGDDLDRLFGASLPVPNSNLELLEGGQSLRFGDLSLDVLYTPGHASHHVTYFLPDQRIAFVGDTAGICMEGDPFVLPATPPPDIDIPLWDASLDAISALQPNSLFLTHFGFSHDPLRHIDTYRERLHTWSRFADDILKLGLDEPASRDLFLRNAREEAAPFLTPEQLAHYAFNGALDLSWLGLARYHRKRASAVPFP